VGTSRKTDDRNDSLSCRPPADQVVRQKPVKEAGRAHCQLRLSRWKSQHMRLIVFEGEQQDSLAYKQHSALALQHCLLVEFRNECC
jgi:hypothetical protein